MYQFWDMLGLRAVVFHPKAREAIRNFPDEVRDALGQALFLLQQGETLSMPLSRRMPRVGRGVEELRVRGRDGIYRVFHLSESEDYVFVIHAFQKKTQRTLPLDIELAKKRLKEMLHD